MEFKKYQHIERYGKDETEGIELGSVYVFPKLDGTNASCWLDDQGNLMGGSRNRQLTLENDNQGFYAYILQNENIKKYLDKHPTHRLYGEWLVPHSLRTYRDEAWRKFYIFDVCIDTEDSVEYLTYDIYKEFLDEFNLDYIPPICIIQNGSLESFQKCLERNIFLIKDDSGYGEGCVYKNYGYHNKYGRQTWAKIVRNEFKDVNMKAMKCNEFKDKTSIEQKIIDKYCTSSFIEKEYAKIVNETNGWNSKKIPMLLGRCYSELIKEETWNFVKENKYPTINFKLLNNLAIQKIKQVKADLF